MHSFSELSTAFANFFDTEHFPENPQSLYEPNRYFLKLGGKRVRPLLVLMGNELFDDIKPDAWFVANAIELFHNFTLIHDDIMDAAPLRRGMPTVHEKFGIHTALLAGDVMLVKAYDYLNQVDSFMANRVIKNFNIAATMVCEGQQLDMDFEKRDDVSLDEYIRMIALKTSVLLAGALRIGSIIGGAGLRNSDHLYEFGKNLGIAFQVQDDYLDAFGDPEKFGKQVGGDILANKKTFLLINSLNNADETQKAAINTLLGGKAEDKVEKMLALYKETGADKLTRDLQQQYYEKAMYHLEEVAVLSARKKPLKELAEYLIARIIKDNFTILQSKINMRKRSMDELNRKSVHEFRESEKLPVTVMLDNVRSMHNVGSIFRTADAFLIEKIILCGYTPQPPHRDINKTALGATETVAWEYAANAIEAIQALKARRYRIVAVEQAEGSTLLPDLELAKNSAICIILGNEVEGVQDDVLELCDDAIEIPQLGMKHSLNVSVAAGIVLYRVSELLNAFAS